MNHIDPLSDDGLSGGERGDPDPQVVNPYSNSSSSSSLQPSASLQPRQDRMSTESAIEAILVMESQPTMPRFWTALAMPAISFIAFLVLSGVMALVAFYVVLGDFSPEMVQQPDSMARVSGSRIGLTLMVVFPQLAMVLPAIIAAYLSPVSFRKRLGLVRGNWPIWAWIAAACATPLVGLMSTLVLGAFVEESESLKYMTDVFREHGSNGFLIPLALMIGATPAICEELLFRGYVQTRLSQSIGPWFGIGIASFLFALFHMDWVHILAVFPLGLFMGIVAWRSGSLIPAMLGHFVNNVISVVAVVFAPQNETDTLALPVAVIWLSIMAAGFAGGLAVIAAIIRYPPPTNELQTAVAIPEESTNQSVFSQPLESRI